MKKIKFINIASITVFFAILATIIPVVLYYVDRLEFSKNAEKTLMGLHDDNLVYADFVINELAAEGLRDNDNGVVNTVKFFNEFVLDGYREYRFYFMNKNNNTCDESYDTVIKEMEMANRARDDAEESSSLANIAPTAWQRSINNNNFENFYKVFRESSVHAHDGLEYIQNNCKY